MMKSRDGLEHDAECEMYSEACGCESRAQLTAAADVLAHQLMMREYPALLDRYWKLRGGHDKCTVCNPPKSSG